MRSSALDLRSPLERGGGMPLPTGSVLLRSVVRCSLQVVGKSGERVLSRVLLRIVESGTWRVERDFETFASLTRWIRGEC